MKRDLSQQIKMNETSTEKVQLDGGEEKKVVYQRKRSHLHDTFMKVNKIVPSRAMLAGKLKNKMGSQDFGIVDAPQLVLPPVSEQKGTKKSHIKLQKQGHLLKHIHMPKLPIVQMNQSYDLAQISHHSSIKSLSSDHSPNNTINQLQAKEELLQNVKVTSITKREPIQRAEIEAENSEDYRQAYNQFAGSLCSPDKLTLLRTNVQNMQFKKVPPHNIDLDVDITQLVVKDKDGHPNFSAIISDSPVPKMAHNYSLNTTIKGLDIKNSQQSKHSNEKPPSFKLYSNNNSPTGISYFKPIKVKTKQINVTTNDDQQLQNSLTHRRFKSIGVEKKTIDQIHSLISSSQEMQPLNSKGIMNYRNHQNLFKLAHSPSGTYQDIYDIQRNFNDTHEKYLNPLKPPNKKSPRSQQNTKATNPLTNGMPTLIGAQSINQTSNPDLHDVTQITQKRQHLERKLKIIDAQIGKNITQVENKFNVDINDPLQSMRYKLKENLKQNQIQKMQNQFGVQPQVQIRPPEQALDDPEFISGFKTIKNDRHMYNIKKKGRQQVETRRANGEISQLANQLLENISISKKKSKVQLILEQKNLEIGVQEGQDYEQIRLQSPQISGQLAKVLSKKYSLISPNRRKDRLGGGGAAF